MSSGTKTPVKPSMAGSETGSPTTPRFGIRTFETSTGALLTSIREWLTSLPAGRPVSRSPLPAVGPQPVTAETWSPQCCEQLASFDPGAYCWKTPQLQLFGDTFSILSSLDCVKWGMWDDTGLFRLKMPSGLIAIREHLRDTMSGSEPGSSRKLSTPRANERGDYQRDRGDPSKPRLTLSGAVKKLPTLSSSMQTMADREQAKYAGDDPRRPSYQEAVGGVLIPRKCPTPSARDWRSGKASPETMDKNSRPLNEVIVQAEMLPRKLASPIAAHAQGTHGGGQRTDLRTDCGGQLNPDWEEWFMGWPVGWTDAEPLARDRFRRWLILSRRF